MTFSDYLKLTFGSKVYRLALSTGCTCPNRDGTAGFGGCTFCSAGGSGDFAESGDIQEQIAKAKLRVEGKFPKTPGTERKYIAYFQSFSNTYVNDFSDAGNGGNGVSGTGGSFAGAGSAVAGAPHTPANVGHAVNSAGNSLGAAGHTLPGAGSSVAGAGQALSDTDCSVAGAGETLSGTGCSLADTGKALAGTPPARNGISFSALEAMFRTAIEQPEIVALSIGTRPDCLDDRMILMLAELNRIKPVWVELGLQTIHEKTAERINRGYRLEVFLDTWERLKAAGLAGIVHLIFGLPGETEEDMLESAAFLGKLQPPPDGVKFANLQILRGTKTAEEFADHPEDFLCFTMEEYTSFLEQAVSLLSPQTVVHRLTGDGPKALLIEPKWSADKKRVLNCLKAHGLL